MAVTTDIVSSWRHPRQAIRRHLARGVSEPFAFTLLLVFLVMAFVGQWPLAAREAYLAADASVAPRLLARALAVLATIPVFYALAALSRLVARSLGGRGGWYAARLALFWALATISPLMLLQGLLRGFLGDTTAVIGTSAMIFGIFLIMWVIMLHEVEQG
jgi:hypothetical protein